ncbi:DUF5615 family PIN-like protein [Sphaerotilus sulfidivorans]|nr:hypothetical protein CQA4T8M7_28920 [Sphaerotilus natans]
MKLLLDENLSRRLVPSLQAVYPGSSQVDLLDLSGANDHAVWTYARAHDFAIVTKDTMTTWTGLTYLDFTTPGYSGIDNIAVAPAVPEPGTVAMMLAGLGALAFMSRRSKMN